MVTVIRGQVWLCDLNPVVGSEQSGQRPVLILQTDRANAVSPHTVIASFTSKIHRALLTSHVLIPAGTGGLRQASVLLCEQVRVIDRQRLITAWGHLDAEQMSEVEQALRIILGL